MLRKFLDKTAYLWSMFSMFTEILKATKGGLLVTFVKRLGRELDTFTIPNFDKCAVELLICG